MRRKCTCSQCGHVTVIKARSWELNHGCPIVQCEKCKADVLNKHCRELAISRVFINNILPITGETFLVLLIGLFNLYCCFPGKGQINIDPKTLLAGIFLVGVSLLAALGDLMSFGRRRNFIKEERLRSAERCADSAYVEKLLDMGYKYTRKK